MKKYSVIIAEDSPSDRDIIAGFIGLRAELTVAGIARDGGEALELLKKKSFDLLFLDIDMPVFSGFDVLNFSGDHVPPYLVITTAYPDFAVEAFSREALDFLVKPFTLARFNRTIERFFERLQKSGIPAEKSRNIVSIAGKGYRYLINSDDIIYLSSHGKQTVLHCRKIDRAVPLLLNDVLKLLPQEQFIRIHKQFVAGKNHIDSFESDFTGNHLIKLSDSDDTVLPVGRSFLQAVSESLAK